MMLITPVTKRAATLIERRSARLICLRYAESLRPNNQIRTFRPLSERAETQVYLAEFQKTGPMVVKRHLKRHAYSSEILALTMYGKIALTPTLIGPPDDGQLIFGTEYFGTKFLVKSRADLCEVARRLAMLHGFAGLCISKMGAFAEPRQPTLGTLLAASKVRRSKKLIEQSIEVLGLHHRPVAIGDIKREHLRASSDGCAFIDMETFGWGKLEISDLYSLASFEIARLSFEIKARCIADAYCSARQEIDSRWRCQPEILFGWLSQF